MADPGYPFELQPWVIYRGDAVSYPIIDTNADGSMFDLTTLGTTWTCQLARTPDAAKLDVTVDASNASGTGGAGVPQLVLSLAGVDTGSLSPRSGGYPDEPDYYCDVQVTGGVKSPLTPYKLGIYLDRDVTE